MASSAYGRLSTGVHASCGRRGGDCIHPLSTRARLASGAQQLLRNGRKNRACSVRARAAPICCSATPTSPVGTEATPALPLGQGSAPPNVLDGTTRLYYSSMCPFAQRVSIAVNFKELVDVERVEINLNSKPDWYKEKVYPAGKVPALEHNGEVIGESLDLLAYLEKSFGGPPLYPQDGKKRAEAEELVGYAEELIKEGYSALSEADLSLTDIEASFGPVLDHLETTLQQQSAVGPFFLGQFGVVDVVFAPFLERFYLAFDAFRQYDITAGRPRLAAWFDAIEQVPAYKRTRVDPEKIIATYKRMLENNYFRRVGVAAQKEATSKA